MSSFNPHVQIFKVWDEHGTFGQKATDKVLQNIATSFALQVMPEEILLKDELVDLENLVNVDILTLVNYLFKNGGLSRIFSFFRERIFLIGSPSQAKSCSDYENIMLSICYKEGCRCWDLWARQARNIQLVYIEDTWICLKSLLNRGPEVHTNMHKKAGIANTQDSVLGKIDHLSAEHQQVIKTIDDNQRKPCFLSMKKDGSLAGVQIYPRDSKQGRFMFNFIRSRGNEFHNMLLDACTEYDFFIVLSSNGTLMINDNMLPYIVSAILCGMFRIPPYDIDVSNSPCAVFAPHMCGFVERIRHFASTFAEEIKQHPIFLSFEAICKNRCDLWGNKHPELAIAYDTYSFTFLGTMVQKSTSNFPNTFLPHFACNDTTMFDCPYYWETFTDRVTSIMMALSAVIYETKTPIEFLAEHPPQNMRFGEIELDYEGFILYTHTERESELLYSKVKTNEYYIGHNYHEENISKLLSLPESASTIFPLISRIRLLHGQLSTRLASICQALRTRIKQISDCASEPTEEIRSILNSLDRKTLETFHRKNDIAIRAKMLLNVSPVWIEQLCAFYSSEFGMIDVSEKNCQTLKQVSMKLCVWEDNSPKVDEFVSNKDDALFRKFMDLLLSLN